MHVSSGLFRRVAFIAIIYLISHATAAPTIFPVESLPKHADIILNQREFLIELPVEWDFEFTDPPQTFDRLSTAAEHLDYLYELAKDSVIDSNSARVPPLTAVAFRVGAFALTFRATGSTSDGDATIPWRLILYFCNSMQYNLALGAVWKFDGRLSSRSLGEQVSVIVQLKLISEFGKI